MTNDHNTSSHNGKEATAIDQFAHHEGSGQGATIINDWTESEVKGGYLGDQVGVRLVLILCTEAKSTLHDPVLAEEEATRVTQAVKKKPYVWFHRVVSA